MSEFTIPAVDLPPSMAWGESYFAPAGEPYRIIPDSLLGELSRSAQHVLKAILKKIGKLRHTDMTDRELVSLTGLSFRAVQRALFELHQLLKAIVRQRKHGRRIITFIKDVLSALPKPAPAISPKPSPKTASPTTKEEPAPAEPAPTAEEVGRRSARHLMNMMAIAGYEPTVYGDKVEWTPAPGKDQKRPSEGISQLVIARMADIRKLIEEDARKAKE